MPAVFPKTGLFSKGLLWSQVIRCRRYSQRQDCSAKDCYDLRLSDAGGIPKDRIVQQRIATILGYQMPAVFPKTGLFSKGLLWSQVIRCRRYSQRQDCSANDCYDLRLSDAGGIPKDRIVQQMIAMISGYQMPAVFPKTGLFSKWLLWSQVIRCWQYSQRQDCSANDCYNLRLSGAGSIPKDRIVQQRIAMISGYQMPAIFPKTGLFSKGLLWSQVIRCRRYSQRQDCSANDCYDLRLSGAGSIPKDRIVQQMIAIISGYQVLAVFPKTGLFSKGLLWSQVIRCRRYSQRQDCSAKDCYDLRLSDAGGIPKTGLFSKGLLWSQVIRCWQYSQRQDCSANDCYDLRLSGAGSIPKDRIVQQRIAMISGYQVLAVFPKTGLFSKGLLWSQVIRCRRYSQRQDCSAKDCQDDN